jgi:hypothetical protein
MEEVGLELFFYFVIFVIIVSGIIIWIIKWKFKRLIRDKTS